MGEGEIDMAEEATQLLSYSEGPNFGEVGGGISSKGSSQPQE